MSISSHPAELAATADDLPAWKQEISDRVSAHRKRRGAFKEQQAELPGMEAAAPNARTASVAARVAARYAKTPTYREALAAEAAKAARAAEAAAQAAREAQEAAQAFTDVLWAGLDPASDLDLNEPGLNGPGLNEHRQQSERRAEEATAARIFTSPANGVPQYHVDPASLPASRRSTPPQPGRPQTAVEPYPQIVDPFEEALVAPAQPLPARVLEFPRELVAARKARPRLAEGPLRETGAQPEKAQLRIFEVEPENISHQPAAVSAADEPPVLPEWTSIRLDAAPRIAEAELRAASEATGVSMPDKQSFSDDEERPFSSRATKGRTLNAASAERMGLPADLLPLQVAPMEDRAMAAIVDSALVLCAFLLFVLVFVACTIHPPTGKPAMVAAGLALAGLAGLYQWLFFTYAESTPGMRYARIALCTFDNENPDRKTMQRRVAATFLAILPLGLGILWAFLDDDRLGWHDRMTRTYQRSYK
ncbi:MAG TPA: RDD family protein [Acidobacteriaceae bacterium]|nr:RDD family protein [Acidobacteriaceae bacterium]